MYMILCRMSIAKGASDNTVIEENGNDDYDTEPVSPCFSAVSDDAVPDTVTSGRRKWLSALSDTMLAKQLDDAFDICQASVERIMNAALIVENDKFLSTLNNLKKVNDKAKSYTLFRKRRAAESDSPATSDMDDELPFVMKAVFEEGIPDNIKTRGDQQNRLPYPLQLKRNKREVALKDNATNVKGNEHIVICDKSILLFDGIPNEEVRNDVTNTVLLAQLNADKKLRKECEGGKLKDAESVERIKYWTKEYIETLRHTFWMSTDAVVDEFQATTQDCSIDKILIEIIESFATGEQKDKVKAAFSILKSLPEDDGKFSVFKKSTVQRDITQVAINMITIDSRGMAQMKTVMLGISTKQKVTNVLWFGWKDQNTKIYKVEQTLNFVHNMYGSLKATLENKLKELNSTYVEYITL